MGLLSKRVKINEKDERLVVWCYRSVNKRKRSREKNILS
jgi:hypothetical protein